MTATTTETGLEAHGISPRGRVIHNPTTAQLYTHALANGDGRLAHGGALVVDTGRFTGRSPQDKFVVDEDESRDRIWWGAVNHPLSEQHFDGLRTKVTEHLAGRDPLYVVDHFAGANPDHRVGVRVVTASPYHALFAKTMFIVPTARELVRFSVDALVLHAPDVEADPGGGRHAHGDVRRAASDPQRGRDRRDVLRGRDQEGDLQLMNDRLPRAGVLPMHCSANVGAEDGRVAVFFGLSGTGKTTLSADPDRSLIGDDEHGWSDEWRLQHRGRLLRQGDQALGGGRAADLADDADVRDDSRERRGRRRGSDRSRRRREDREHEGRVQARAHRERASDQTRGASELRRLPRGGCLRRPAADRAPLARPGDVLVPLGLHREARGHRARGDRAPADFLDVLRRAVPPAAPCGVRAACSARSSTSTARACGS